jgi:hypothetical protein
LHLTGCIVEDAKVTRYLLNPAHRIGGPKSRFFQAHGFTLEDWEGLRDALLDHPLRNTVVQHLDTDHGRKFTVECNMVTPDGRNPCVRTVWLRPGPADAPVLVTAYPA